MREVVAQAYLRTESASQPTVSAQVFAKILRELGNELIVQLVKVGR
jgi:hypothetical protein